MNELRELVQYYEQTSDMVVDTVNENVKEDDDETEDGSLFEAMFDSEQENHEPVTNIRYRKDSLQYRNSVYSIESLMESGIIIKVLF